MPTWPLACQPPCALGCTAADRVRAQGVRLVFYNDESDILLLQQMSEIPRDFKPFFMGGPCSVVQNWHRIACAGLQAASWVRALVCDHPFLGIYGWALTQGICCLMQTYR